MPGEIFTRAAAIALLLCPLGCAESPSEIPGQKSSIEGTDEPNQEALTFERLSGEAGLVEVEVRNTGENSVDLVGVNVDGARFSRVLLNGTPIPDDELSAASAANNGAWVSGQAVILQIQFEDSPGPKRWTVNFHLALQDGEIVTATHTINVEGL